MLTHRGVPRTHFMLPCRMQLWQCAHRANHLFFSHHVCTNKFDIEYSCLVARCDVGKTGGFGTCQQCVAGTYQPTMTVHTPCQDCPVGSYCPTGSETPTPCDAGTFSSATKLISAAQCQSCAAGTYCPSGSSNATICSAGSYCPNATASLACTQGTYNSHSGQVSESACVTCPAGMFCPANSAVTLSCPENTYSNAGSGSIEQCLNCSFGTSSSVGSPYCSLSCMFSELCYNSRLTNGSQHRWRDSGRLRCHC